MLFRLWLVGLFVFPVAHFATSENPSHPYFEVVSDGESVKHPSKIFNGWSHSPLKIFPIAVNLNFSVSRSLGVSQECMVQISSKKSADSTFSFHSNFWRDGIILFNPQLYPLQEEFQHNGSGSIGGSSWKYAFCFYEWKLRARLLEYVSHSVLFLFQLRWGHANY